MTNCNKILNVWPIVLIPTDVSTVKGIGVNKEFICTSVGCQHGPSLTMRKKKGAVSVVYLNNTSTGYCINCIEEFMASLEVTSCDVNLNPYLAEINIIIPHQKTRKRRVKAYHFVRAILSAFNKVRIYPSGVKEP